MADERSSDGSGEADVGNRMRDQAILVTGAVDFIGSAPAYDPAAANAPSKVCNVGNHHPEGLTHGVGFLEQGLTGTAIKELLPRTFWKRSRMSMI
ncbi:MULTISPECIES: hypothetical protein [unclassified Bradyrhizobium]|uniref:hypothetical protein n=1 Tax=unclassified Bradyrhizobium TaxID=2631580 RepID=UPI00339333FF